MSWTAIVPLGIGRERKSRLAGRLSTDERTRLADSMAAHVLSCVKTTPEVERVMVLSPHALVQADVEWRRDFGRGLNAELTALRETVAGFLLVIHGDLPLLGIEDVSALLAAAQGAGVALAADRHGRGTNAVALRPEADFVFAFGEDSLARHASTPGAVTLVRSGLGWDVDLPADLDAVLATGWRCGN